MNISVNQEVSPVLPAGGRTRAPLVGGRTPDERGPAAMRAVERSWRSISPIRFDRTTPSMAKTELTMMIPTRPSAQASRVRNVTSALLGPQDVSDATHRLDETRPGGLELAPKETDVRLDVRRVAG